MKQKPQRYARMFFNAVGVDAVSAAIEELLVVNSLIEKSRDFRGVLESPVFSPEEREKVLHELTRKIGLNEKTVRFLLYLSEQKMTAQLNGIISVLVSLYLEKKQRAKALVITPIGTDQRYEERLKAALKAVTGRDTDIEYQVDPDLIGGMIVKVGSTMYDSSIRGQLRLLKDDLMKG